MATTTPIYGWPVPTSSDLVKNGATAIEALGDAADATMATMVPKSLVDAKGDIIAASASDVPARLAVGSNGETLVADSSATTGLRYQGNYAAGKNAIINGAMNVWQRGISITVPIANNSYSGADRFQFSRNGTGSVVTCSRVAFTPGTAPQSGYEGNYFMRFNQTTAGTTGSYNEMIYRIEDVTTFAGQTITFSFWAKADSSRTLPTPVLNQNFGSGGSGQVGTNITLNSNALTTAWARYTGTVSVPSISGKTIGTSSYLEIDMQLFMNTTFTFDTWGWQLEAGSVATAFQTATGTLQGELAACQRYYQVIGGTANSFPIFGGYGIAGTPVYIPMPFPVTMRIAPTITKNGTWGGPNVGQPSAIYISPQGFSISASVTAAGNFYVETNSTDDTFTISAEL
jgi:hypothetical protein